MPESIEISVLSDDEPSGDAPATSTATTSVAKQKENVDVSAGAGSELEPKVPRTPPKEKAKAKPTASKAKAKPLPAKAKAKSVAEKAKAKSVAEKAKAKPKAAKKKLKQSAEPQPEGGGSGEVVDEVGVGDADDDELPILKKPAGKAGLKRPAAAKSKLVATEYKYHKHNKWGVKCNGAEYCTVGDLFLLPVFSVHKRSFCHWCV